MGADPYFKVHNSTDQRRMNAVKDEDVKLEEESVTYKKSRMGQRIRFESYSRELDREFKRWELYEQNWFNKIGNFIKTLRCDLKLSQDDLAKNCVNNIYKLQLKL